MKKAFVLFIIFLFIVYSLYSPFTNSTQAAIENFTLVSSFPSTNNSILGKEPAGKLLVINNTIYGVTNKGGGGYGTVFAVETDGTNLRSLHTFNNTDGAYPYGGLLLADNKLFGTTTRGGANNAGVVFSLNTDGSGYQILHQFNNISGGQPNGALILVNDILYGTTYTGGVNFAAGFIFSINKDGTGFQLRYEFGNDPLYSGSPQGSLLYENSLLYGITSSPDTIFSVNPDGSNYQTIHEFTNGVEPYRDISFANGYLYGVTMYGGSNFTGELYSLNISNNAYQTLYNFTGDTNGGYNPEGTPEFYNGKLYGTSVYGGSEEYGDIYAFDLNTSQYEVLYSFDTQANDGHFPRGSFYRSGEIFYGMTKLGGSANNGVIYQYDLTPVVPTSTPTLTPTATSVPAATQIPTMTPSLSPATPAAAQYTTNATSTGSEGCSDPMPWKPPYIFQIDTDNTTATIYFVPAGDPVNKYYVEYTSVKDNPQHGLVYDENHNASALKLTIHKLKANVIYYYRIKGGNGCSVGGWSNIVAARTTGNARSYATYYPGSVTEKTTAKMSSLPRPTPAKNKK